MRIGIYSNAHSPSHGGGAVFIFAIAAALVQRHEVFLHLPGEFAPDRATALFPGIEGMERVRFVPVPARAGPLREVGLALYDRRFDAVLRQDSNPPPLTLNRRAAVLCEFPLIPVHGWRNRLRLRSYRTILGNSRFTADWIARRWGRPATVLYPPVTPIPALDKKPWILGVGRFLGSRRNKRQLEMVGLFRKLCQDAAAGWELHLAGFVQDREYLARVRTAATGLPVHLHLDLSRAALEALYGHASIFWHAVGEGFDQETQPDLMEHFGIVTAEAMSAGCVPVVINRGGQPEIVGTTGEAGVLWETFDDCAGQTLALIRDPPRLAAIGGRAQERATEFAFPRFCERVHELFPVR